MRWALKFTTKGKREGGPDAGKSVGTAAIDSFRNGGSGSQGGGAGQGGFRSSSDGDGEHDNAEREAGEIEVSNNSRTPIVTPPDANGETGGAAGEKESSQQAEAENNSAPPFTVDSQVVGGGAGAGENGEDYRQEGEGEEDWAEMDAGGVGGNGGDRQDDVFEDDSQEDADSLHASKTARMKSFADDPEAHVLGDTDAEWDGAQADSGGDRGDPRDLNSASRGDDRFSGNGGGGGSHSYHSEGRSADATGTEEGYGSHASPDHPGGGRARTSTDGMGGKSTTYTSFGGTSGGVSLGHADGVDGEGRRLDEGGSGGGGGIGGGGHHDLEEEDEEEEYEEEEDIEEEEDDDDDETHEDEEEEDEEEEDEEEEMGRHQDHVGGSGGGVMRDNDHRDPANDRHGNVNPVGGGGGGGGGRSSREHNNLERRAIAHAYADGLDGVSREAPPYGGGPTGAGGGGGGGGVYANAERLQSRSSTNSAVMPPAPPVSAGANGISPVDARAAAALSARTRLAAGGVAVPDRAGGLQRPEPGPVMAAGQAAAAAEAALRRGPTPGSHSLPSMVLVPLEALKAHRRVPRSSDRRALVRYRDLPDRSRSFVVFVSHAWMRPHTTPSFAHPDTSSRGGEKYRLIAEAGDRIRAHLPPDVRVLLWIDYSCVDQDSTRRSKATMRGMREYMRRCDAILTVYPGDAADNGEEFLPNRFVKSCSWAGSYKSLAHYCTRGWCRLEMLLGQTEPLPQDGFMFNFLVPKKKKASGAKASVGDRPHFLYGAHQRPHNGRIDVVPRQSSRWFEEHHPEQGNFTHESDRDAIRAVLAKQTSTMAKRTAAIAARYGTDPRRGVPSGNGGTSSSAAAAQAAAAAARPGGGSGGDRQQFAGSGEYGRPL